MKHARLGVLGAALVGLVVVSLVLSALFCSIPWSMVSKG
jgi:hypothetical protein